MRGPLRVVLLAMAPLAWGAACREPTQIMVSVSTDAACTEVVETSLVVGQLGSLEPQPFAATTTTSHCDASYIGSIVLVPKGSKDDAVAVEVVASLRSA